MGPKRKFPSFCLNRNCFAYHSGGPGIRQTRLPSNLSSATGDSGPLGNLSGSQSPHLSSGRSNSTHLIVSIVAFKWHQAYKAPDKL